MIHGFVLCKVSIATNFSGVVVVVPGFSQKLKGYVL